MGEEGGHLLDKIIVTDILNGNVQAYAIVVKNTEKLITQIVCKMLTNADDQKDLVQIMIAWGKIICFSLFITEK